MRHSLRDPLEVLQAGNILIKQFAGMGLILSISSNFEELSRIRKTVRDSKISPMFDPAINSLNEKNSFWMKLENNTGETMAYQAFRIDTIDGSLAEWATGWMAGQYLLRSELVVPSVLTAPIDSVTWKLKGPVVYHGEVWVNRFVGKRTCSTTFARLGMILCLIKWHPNAIWGVMSRSMATFGHATRAGYPRTEAGFLRWKIPPSGAEKDEFIVIAKSSDLELIVHETTVKAP